MSSRMLRVALAAVVGLVLAACSQAEAPAVGNDDNFITNAPEKEVQTASAEAVQSLPAFWSAFERQAPGTSDFMVKVGMPVGDGRTESIWADVLRRDGQTLHVRLANDPVWLTSVQNGSELTVPLDQVVDWTYSRDGKAFGHFTTRAMMPSAPPALRAEAQAFLAPTPLEPESK
jgi:uncharacterized protein YegJ (DUF2314 family)